MLDWHIKPFYQLTVDELYELLALRSQVFIVEQQCIYQDLDSLDKESYHVMGYQGVKLIAYARILAHKHATMMSFGRVVTAREERNKHYGKELITQVLAYLTKYHAKMTISISAQHYLKSFYQSFGFVAIGEVYDEDGIPHIRMDYQ